MDIDALCFWASGVVHLVHLFLSPFSSFPQDCRRLHYYSRNLHLHALVREVYLCEYAFILFFKVPLASPFFKEAC